jgi:hypothetical protein
MQQNGILYFRRHIGAKQREGCPMDFIEQWFGVSPDGGDGSTEALYILAVVVVIALFVARRQIAKAFGRWRT